MKKLLVSMVALLALASAAMAGSVAVQWGALSPTDAAKLNVATETLPAEVTVTVPIYLTGNTEIDAASMVFTAQSNALYLPYAPSMKLAGMYFQPANDGGSSWSDGLVPVRQRGYNIFNPTSDDPETPEDELVHLPILSDTPTLLGNLQIRVLAGTPAGTYKVTTDGTGFAYAGTTISGVAPAVLSLTVVPEPATALLLLGALPLLRRRR